MHARLTLSPFHLVSPFVSLSSLMSLLELLSLLIAAILLAGLYATMSYGLGLIYGVMRIVNVSHAGFMMLGAYAAYIMIHPDYGINLNPFIAPFVVIPVFFAAGM